MIPDHTKHCKLCNGCCNGFDHHCMWLTSCVGYNNHRVFVLFTIALGLDNFLFVWQAYSCKYHCIHVLLPYSGKLLREKTIANWWKGSILWRKLSRNVETGHIVSVVCQKFHGENFHGWLKNHKIHESFLPRKFPTIRYCGTCILILFEGFNFHR